MFLKKALFISFTHKKSFCSDWLQICVKNINVAATLENVDGAW